MNSGHPRGDFRYFSQINGRQRSMNIPSRIPVKSISENETAMKFPQQRIKPDAMDKYGEVNRAITIIIPASIKAPAATPLKSDGLNVI